MRAIDVRIGELAKATATPVETIRYYEREGLLAALARTEGNFRLYEEAQVERLLFIRHCRTLDMALEEIRVLLRFKDAPDASCCDVNTLLDEHIGHVAVRIRELRALERQLTKLREQCPEASDAAHCGILQELSKPARSAAPASSGHVQSTHGGVRK